MPDFRLNLQALKQKTPPPPKANEKPPEAAPTTERKAGAAGRDALKAASEKGWAWDEEAAELPQPPALSAADAAALATSLGGSVAGVAAEAAASDGEPSYEQNVAAFTEADADRNGYLGSDEMKDQQAFALMDVNADGKVGLDEYLADQAAEAEAAALLGEHDTDENGYLSSDEVADQAAFQAMDVDADGKVTTSELRAGQAKPATGEAADEAGTAEAQPQASYRTAHTHTAEELASQLGFGSVEELSAANPQLGAVTASTPVPAETTIYAPADNQAVTSAMQTHDSSNGGGRFNPSATPSAAAATTEPSSAEPAGAEPAEVPAADTPAADAPTTASPAASGDTGKLLGAMTAADIEAVLVQRGSVLAGQGYGDYVLKMEKQYGVPAAQFLAQAIMESSLGNDGYTQPGFNIGNIRPGSSWDGPIVDGGSGKFRVYNSWEEGIEDYFSLLAGPIYAGKNLEEQLYTYCPPSDGNDTAHYHDQIVKLIYQWTGIQM
jgi:Ca2+-binding EF-hand superfamily protein